MSTNTSEKTLTSCYLVIRYRTYRERWLHAICSSQEDAIPRVEIVKQWIQHGYQGCKPDDTVIVEETFMDHLYGGALEF